MWIYLIFISLVSIYACNATDALLEDGLTSHPFIRQFAERLNVLEARDLKQQQQLDAQNKEIVELHDQIAKKDQHISALLNHYGVPEKNKAEIRASDAADSSSRMRRFENEMNVSFFAGLTRPIQHAGENQIIVFNKVETNVGNGYQQQNGVFSAPVAGTYFFTTSIMTMSGRKICELVVNGIKKAQVYTHGDGHYDHGSQTIIVGLHKADNVSVQIVEHNYDNTIYGEGVPYTTFSGFLLQQDYSDLGTIVG